MAGLFYKLETILVHYPLIEATKGAGKHPSEAHSCTSPARTGFRPAQKQPQMFQSKVPQTKGNKDPETQIRQN